MRYLGVDFGLKRIGLATSEGGLSSPFKILEVKNFKNALEKIIQEIKIGDFDKVVVGLPEGKMGQTVLGFIKALKKAGLSVEEADETLSSQKAMKQMIESGLSKKDRSVDDSVAAAIILQDYLDSR